MQAITSRRSVAVALVAASVLASCSSNSVAQPTTTTSTTVPAVVGAVTTSTAVDGATTTTAAPDTIAAGDVSDDTEAPSVTDAPRPLHPGEKLDTATTYATSDLIGRAADITFAGPEGDSYGASELGALVVSTDPGFSHPLLQAVEMDFTRLFTDPLADADDVKDGDTVVAPDDVLSEFASRPGVTATPVADGELGGLPAHQIHYSIAAFDGEGTCTAIETGGCFAFFYDPIGVAFDYVPGQAGTMYELDVESRRVVVDIADGPTAAGLESSIGFVPHRPTNVTADQHRLPFRGSVTQGASYYWTYSSLGTYVLSPGDGLQVVAQSQPTAYVQIAGADGVPCMSVSDGSVADWDGAPVSPTPTAAAFPDDLLDALTGLDGASVTGAQTAFHSNGFAGTTVEMTTTGPEISLIEGSLTLRPGVTTRITVIDRGQGRPSDAVMVDVGSPCESTAASIQVLGTP